MYKAKNEWVLDEEYLDLGEWDEEVRLDIYDEPEFQVMKFGVFVRQADHAVLVGETEIDLTRVQHEAEHDAWWSLTNDGQYAGKVFIELTFYPIRKRRQAKATWEAGPIPQQHIQPSTRQSIHLMQSQSLQQSYSAIHTLSKPAPTAMPALPPLPEATRRWSGSAAQGPTFCNTVQSHPPLQYHKMIGHTKTVVAGPDQQIPGAYPQSPMSPTVDTDNLHEDRGRARDVNYYTLLREQQPHRAASTSSLPETIQQLAGEQPFLVGPANAPSQQTDLARDFAGMSIASQSARRVRRKPVRSPAVVTMGPGSPQVFFSANDIPLPPALEQQKPQRKKEYLPQTAHAPELGTPEGYAAVLDSDHVFREQLDRAAEADARARAKKERELARRELAPGSPALPPKIPLNISREEFLALQTRSRVV
ncbi:hypothetical protein POJ06DRAFT_245786 [Lipomyces tetrasporus]|uniref:Uncharacterized protein n=1 Tax=Lipomyces tetrasporus TaxID=54092 RepID=A0AAD7QX06_9ASCO|nr:uncharacterized protein POJ06DRAFT_245786 [Lipomyces tetrasporus]KAJ8102843.1 hypothetical protein POJ06DRAFT_245786 [Lipomyces tetrasporus]